MDITRAVASYVRSTYAVQSRGDTVYETIQSSLLHRDATSNNSNTNMNFRLAPWVSLVYMKGVQTTKLGGEIIFVSFPHT